MIINRGATLCNRMAPLCNRMATLCNRMATLYNRMATLCNRMAILCNREATLCNRMAPLQLSDSGCLHQGLEIIWAIAASFFFPSGAIPVSNFTRIITYTEVQTMPATDMNRSPRGRSEKEIRPQTSRAARCGQHSGQPTVAAGTRA